MSRSTATRIDPATSRRMTAATDALGIKPSDLLRIGLVRVLKEFEEKGTLCLGDPRQHEGREAPIEAQRAKKGAVAA